MAHHQTPPPSPDDNTAPIPADKAAEMALLGSALIDQDVAFRIASLAQPEDFFYASHQVLAAALTRLAADRRPADLVTIMDEARIMGKGDQLQPAQIVEMMGATPSSAYADHYAAVVKASAYNRRAIAIAGRIAEKAFATTRPEELHAFIQDQIAQLTPTGNHTAVVTWADSHDRYMDILEKRHAQADAGPSPWRWPWEKLNGILSPIEPGYVVEVAGDTGGFKTVFAESATEFWARSGGRVAYFHCELPEQLVYDRRMARWSGINRYDLAGGKLTDEQWAKVVDTTGRISQWPGTIEYVYAPDWDVDRIAAEMEYLARERGIETFVIDHLKNLSVSPRQMQLRMNRTEREADNVRKAKAAAGYCNARLLLINQFTKEGKGVNTADNLSKNDIGGSSEQVDLVNAVILLHREIADTVEADPFTGEIVTKPGEKSRIVSVKVDKNTGGMAPATIKLWAEPQFFRLRDVRIETTQLSE